MGSNFGEGYNVQLSLKLFQRGVDLTAPAHPALIIRNDRKDLSVRCNIASKIHTFESAPH